MIRNHTDLLLLDEIVYEAACLLNRAHKQTSLATECQQIKSGGEFYDSEQCLIGSKTQKFLH